ncbi:hypothetical protein PTNB73_01101 [Pyrenophora teres f. teres]|nr:hypothetical protein PTNB73_01101 [Pyrenophora teres f. teres]
MSFIKCATPASLLDHHRIPSLTAAICVSPLCLGGMNSGEAWKTTLSECTKETAFAMLDHFYAQDGNFIDTTVNGEIGESEEWIKEGGVPDKMVVPTKFTAIQITEREKEGGNRCKSHCGVLDNEEKVSQVLEAIAERNNPVLPIISIVIAGRKISYLESDI